MKIIVNGDSSKAKAIKRFKCNNCGCVFDAEKEEYEIADSLAQQKENLEAYCYCPCCKHKVWREFGES